MCSLPALSARKYGPAPACHQSQSRATWTSEHPNRSRIHILQFGRLFFYQFNGAYGTPGMVLPSGVKGTLRVMLFLEFAMTWSFGRAVSSRPPGPRAAPIYEFWICLVLNLFATCPYNPNGESLPSVVSFQKSYKYIEWMRLVLLKSWS